MRLRSKITVALLALALIPLAVSTGILVRVNYGKLIEDARVYRKAVAEHSTLAVREVLNQALNELSTMGHLIVQRELSEQQKLRQAQISLSGATLVHSVAVFTPQGQRILTFKLKKYGGPQQTDTLKASWRAKAQKTGTHYLPIQFVKDGTPYLGIVQSVFLKKKDTQPFAFLWTSIPLDSLSERLTQLSMRRFAKRPDQVLLLEEKKRVIAHSNRGMWGKKIEDLLPALKTKLRSEGAQFAYTFDYAHKGEEFAASLLPLPQLGWGVVVRQSKAHAYAAVRKTIWVALGVGGAFVILAIILGLFMGRRLSEPIVAVSDAAKQVADGDFTVRVDVESKDEVGEMATSFNSMAGELESYEQKLIKETQIRADLGRYLNNDLVESIVSQTSELKLGGERKVITVLFADVVAFTPLTEAHQPERIVAILNELFTFLTEIIFKHGGIIDKFIGDCVMAVFGAPYTHEDDALRAARAAEEMMRWLEVGNSRWRKELGMELKMAIGINTGEAVVGNIGSQKRMEYTVIGDTVNVAARLESLARPGQILMTEHMVPLIEDEFECASLGEHQLTGKKEPIEIYALVD